ncbi:MAG: hypothetical protein AAGI44_01065 [Pseudomonadota bacterium]
MVARLSAKLVAVLITVFAQFAWSQTSPYVAYDFDGYLPDSGPDTFQVFRSNLHKAKLSQAFAHAGTGSIHFVDPAGDGDFVEFQGYFEEQSQGHLSFGFSVLLTDRDNAFSAALTGTKKYQHHPEGLNFWMIYDGDWLRSYSNSIPKKIIQLETFQWYTVLADIDFDANTYDVSVSDESGNVLYREKSLALAPGRHDHHSVKEFSIVGDISDQLASDFFIDSVYIASSTHPKPTEWVAPGRRSLFVERWNKFQSNVVGRLRCLPAISLEDFGIDHEALGEIFQSNEMDDLLRLTSDQYRFTERDTEELHPKLQALAHWRHACQLLERGEDVASMRASMEASLDLVSDAYIYQLSDIVIRAPDLAAVDLIVEMGHLRDGDLRSEIAMAMLARQLKLDEDRVYFQAPDLSSATQQILFDLERHEKPTTLGDPTQLAIEQLKAFMPDDWRNWLHWAVVTEFQYMALVGSEDYTSARQLAADVSTFLEEMNIGNPLWRERVGDMALLLGEPEMALQQYEAITIERSSSRIDLKSADVHHLLGNKEKERDLRESVYRNFQN